MPKKQQTRSRTMRLEGYSRTKNRISMSYGIGDLSVQTSYCYRDVDLLQLENLYGRECMARVYFHMAAFEASKLISLRPDSLDLGPFAHYHTQQFEQLWRVVIRKVWAQWRYENDLPDYEGPAFLSTPVNNECTPIEASPGPVEILSFCGGGKDSLVAMKLLDRAGRSYSSFAYSHSRYGSASLQHELIDGLLNHGSPVERHQQCVYEGYRNSPILHDHREVPLLLTAETPSSILGALPIALQNGYRYITLAHERSADVGNLIWERTGEDVNHQWGKSLEAELLINDYIQRELVSNISYFSLLKPIHDVLIFNLLRRDLDAVPQTHSCNTQKPWCSQCPKCAYTWLSYMAYLPVELVRTIFDQNLFNIAENQLAFRQMLGLEAHTPFECIGEIAETRLAFELCRRKGLTGLAMSMFTSELPPLDANAVLRKYLSVDTGLSTMPRHIGDPVLHQMREASKTATEQLWSGA